MLKQERVLEQEQIAEQERILENKSSAEKENMAGKEADKYLPGCCRELESLRVEYENQFDRSNKLDNKVYIAITFCGFIFVFITGLFSGISNIRRPENSGEMVVTMFYLLTCIAVVVSYVYVLIFFMRLLKPEQIIRMDPEKLERAELDQMEDLEACRCLIQLYRDTINENLDKLKMRCDEFTKGLRFIVPTVLLAFAAYTFQLILSII